MKKERNLTRSKKRKVNKQKDQLHCILNLNCVHYFLNCQTLITTHSHIQQRQISLSSYLAINMISICMYYTRLTLLSRNRYQ